LWRGCIMARIRNAGEGEEGELASAWVYLSTPERSNGRQGGQRTAPWGQRQETLTNVNKTCRWQGDESSTGSLDSLSAFSCPAFISPRHARGRSTEADEADENNRPSEAVEGFLRAGRDPVLCAGSDEPATCRIEREREGGETGRGFCWRTRWRLYLNEGDLSSSFVVSCSNSHRERAASCSLPPLCIFFTLSASPLRRQIRTRIPPCLFFAHHPPSIINYDQHGSARLGARFAITALLREVLAERVPLTAPPRKR